MVMNVLVLLGGRIGGHTDTLCRNIISSLPGENDVRFLDSCSLDVSDCIGCDLCKTGSGCRFSDDMDEVIERFLVADIILFATPVRFNGPSSQIKRVVDRFQVLWNSPDRLEGKTRYLGLVMSAGSDDPDVAPILKIFRSFAVWFGGRWVGHAIVTGTDSGNADYMSPVSDFVSSLISAVSNDAPTRSIEHACTSNRA